MTALVDSKAIDETIGAADEDLALAAARGSLAAFDTLTRRHERRVYSFLRRRCRHHDDLEDLTQSTFVEAWRCIARYSPQWRFSTWLFTIATRQLTGWLRRAEVQQRALRNIAGTAAGWDCPDDPYEIAAGLERRGTIWTTVESTLDPVQQTALWLRYAESFSIGEIARIMGRSTVTTRVILFRARQALGAALADRDTEQPVHASIDELNLAAIARTMRKKVSHATVG